MQTAADCFGPRWDTWGNGSLMYIMIIIHDVDVFYSASRCGGGLIDSLNIMVKQTTASLTLYILCIFIGFLYHKNV